MRHAPATCYAIDPPVIECTCGHRDTVDGFRAHVAVGTVAEAERGALVAHQADTCHLSEWSCSHCEAERDGAPCCPDPGCTGDPCTFPGYAESH